MRFNSYEFAVFLAVVLLAMPLLRPRGRPWHGFLLASSYVFYATWNPPFVALLLFSTLLDFACGGALGRASAPAARRALLSASLLGNLGVLAYFKYGNFFLDNVAFVSGIDPEPFYLDVVIPLGISFYTFQSMSYTLDVYRGKAEPCRDFLAFALYVTFFPQLIAGPILRVGEFLPQLTRRDPLREEELLRGVELLGLGLFKKVVVADNLAIIADRVFADPSRFDAMAIYTAILCFWIQIYCDFSGYSTMARGVGALLGFKLPRNFDYPILRHNPRLYRQSWHITMGNWFTDYVYRPLGGSRVGDWRFGFNIFVTWTLLGLWHGAAWNFVAWGAWNGFILTVYSVGMRRKRWALPDFAGKKLCGWLVNFNMLLFSAMLFRVGSLGDAGEMTWRVVTGAGGLPISPLWLVAALAAGAVHVLCFFTYREDLLQRLGWPARVAVVSLVACAIAAFASTSRPFIYFQF